MDVKRDTQNRLLPTGDCWCGCGEPTKEPANFWLPGHDKVAESAVINTRYGGVAEFLVEYGFGPGGLNPREELKKWREAGGRIR